MFIGSSTEGLIVVRNLQRELEDHNICRVEAWNRGIFEPSSFTLEALQSAADRADYAVLIATPDDVTRIRDVEHRTMRDNVLFEFGLFIGAIGRNRTYLLAPNGADLRFPSDLSGLTQLRYNPPADPRDLQAALNGAALDIENQIRLHGWRPRTSMADGQAASVRTPLDLEIDMLCANAQAQGWTVRTNSPTTLRLRSPRGRNYTMTKTTPDLTRANLRHFAAKLRAGGLRVNYSVRRDVPSSPL
nr:nucleotide-binding protein [Nocardioides thalensis]